MSDGIWYRGELIGSVHSSFYRERKLPGREEDLFVRMNNLHALETLLKLSPQSRLRVGGNDKSHEMRYERFEREFLAKTRHIHIESNFFD
jgi:hypothetical protein